MDYEYFNFQAVFTISCILNIHCKFYLDSFLLVFRQWGEGGGVRDCELGVAWVGFNKNVINCVGFGI